MDNGVDCTFNEARGQDSRARTAHNLLLLEIRWDLHLRNEHETRPIDH